MKQTHQLDKSDYTQGFNQSQTILYEQGYAIRGIAMLMIIFVHSINEYECYNSEISQLLLIPMFGVLGCSLFFFMSGYGLLFSLCKKKKELKWNYLIVHIKKVLIPVAVVYVVNTIVLPYTFAYNSITIDHSNILTLSLPEGTNIWFIKVLLFDYITTFLLFKFLNNPRIQLVSIVSIQVILIAVLYMFKVGAYWYVSNLCFVLGALHTVCPIFNKKNLFASIILFAFFYFCMVSDMRSMPIQILGNLTFCVLVIFLILKWEKCPKWLCFIGKNSLLYYLLNIPIMWLISSKNMHPSVYFIANLLFTTLSIFIYNGVSNLIKKYTMPYDKRNTPTQ